MVTVKCVKCKEQNPKGNKYCSNCGTSLDPNLGPIRDFLESNLRHQIQSVLKEQLKDQKVVEIETTQEIVARLVHWAKLLGFCAGIPLVILALVLGFLEVKAVFNLSGLVNQAKTYKKEAEQQVGTIKEMADSMGKYKDEADKALAQVKTQLGQKVENLENKVIELEKLTFRPSPALTPDLEKTLKDNFAIFRNYMQQFGLRPEGDRIEVEIDPASEGASYNPRQNLIVLGKSVANDPGVAFRLYTHHTLISLKKDVSVKPDFKDAYDALEYGLAYYFPCSFKNDPLIGEIKVPELFNLPVFINLDNRYEFSAVTYITPPQTVGKIWGGAFWDIRRLVGQAIADKLLFSTWVALEPSDFLNLGVNFVKRLLEIDKDLEGGQHVNQIQSVFEQRGLKL